MEKCLASVDFSEFGHDKSLDGGVVIDDNDSGAESCEETRKMVLKQNRKGKKSGGFQSMGLSYAVFSAVMKKGYRVPTPIQRKCIPVIMDGKDVVAMARTGSGKTAAFLVPLFERLKTHSSKIGARALILSPTRELATQTMKFTKELGRFTSLRATLVLGGDKLEAQFASMHENPDIIIGTPGRFLHLVVEMGLKMSSIEYVIFDEADRLFEMGFAEQLLGIIHQLPETRQTLLFSATLPKQLVEFAKAGLKDPVLVRLDVDSKLSEQLKLHFLATRADDKPAVLLYLLRNVVLAGEQTVVFAATKHHVEYLKELLTAAGISATHTYSSLDQTARKINVAKFVNKKASVMIVTDLAARGIDIPMLDNVINYNFSCKPKLFVHRVGRVARAGRSGCAYSLLSFDEVPYMLDLHLFLGRPVQISSTSRQLVSGIYGSVPQSIIDSEHDALRKLHSTSPLELDELHKISTNAQKQYVRSRTQPAPESVKRAKDLIPSVLPAHPMFEQLCSQEDMASSRLLDSLKSYRPNQTIFEIHSTSKTTAKQVMKTKRKYHGEVLSAVRQKTVQSSSEAAASTDGDAADSGELRLEESSKQLSHRDEEHYLKYTSSDVHSERGLSLGSSFQRDAEGAALDLAGDDDQTSKKKTNIKTWDRKRKKFVGDSNQPKRVKTESGHWIKASYKSHAYQEWKDRYKLDTPLAGAEEDTQAAVSFKKPSRGRKGRFGGDEEDTQFKKPFRGRKGRFGDEEDTQFKKPSRGRKGRFGTSNVEKEGKGTVGGLRSKGEILKKRKMKNMQELARKRKSKKQSASSSKQK